MSKPCTPIPCPDFQPGTLTTLPGVPTLDELRQAGCAIGQPDGSYYTARDNAVVHVSAEEAATERQAAAARPPNVGPGCECVPPCR